MQTLHAMDREAQAGGWREGIMFKTQSNSSLLILLGIGILAAGLLMILSVATFGGA